jgi:predicted aspartyl protease
MPDTGCLSYGLVDSRFAQKHNLQRIRIKPCTMTGYNETNEEVVSEVAVIQGDIDGHIEERMFLYVVPRLALYNIILGLPWMSSNDV